MYKDVKKKLLAVVLCVCMIAGIVEVVPRVQAAATENGGYYKVKVLTYENATEDVYVKLKSGATKHTYANDEYAPAVDKVLKDPSGTGAENDITSQFQSKLWVENANVTGTATNAGTYKAVLRGNGGNYSSTVDGEDNQIEFTIEPAEIRSIQAYVKDSSKTLKFDKSGATPELESVVLILNNSTELTYTGTDIADNFASSKITDLGLNKPSTITLKDKAQSNFTNGGIISASVTCDVAYDLADKTYISLDQSLLPFTGRDLSGEVTATIYDKDREEVAKNETKDSERLKFTFKYNGAIVEEVKNAGTYQVEITPKGGEDKLVAMGSGDANWYTGKFIGEFTVGQKTDGVWMVQAYDFKSSKSVDLLGSNAVKPYYISVDHKNSAGLVLPGGEKGFTVSIDGHLLKEDEYSLTFIPTDPTTPGFYTMVITPKDTGNYGGSKKIDYYVYGEMEVKQMKFAEWYALNPQTMTYNGGGYKVDTENLIVESKGTQLTYNTHFKIKYQYKDGKYVDADAYNAAEMQTVGAKRVVFEGIGAYSGVVCYWNYQIDKLSMKDSDEAANFELKLDTTGEYYTGKEIKPTYTFKYNGIEVNEDYYEIRYEDNIDAGTAKVIALATADGPFKDSKTETFEIYPLSLNNAECVGDGICKTDPSKYSYTGNPIEPTFIIDTYELKSKDYQINRYYYKADKEWKNEAPTNRGEYTVEILAGSNKNIQGTSKKIDFSIIPRKISEDTDISFQLVHGNSYEWNGGVVEPEVICAGTLKLEEGVDYTIDYEKNTAPTVGTAVSAAAIVRGTGNLEGDKTMKFEITNRSIAQNIVVEPNVTGTAPNYAVTFKVTDNGAQVAPANKTLKNTDYEIESITYKTEKGYNPTDISKLERAGEYEVVLKGTGRYTDTLSVTVKCGVDISGAKLKVGKEKLTYNGVSQHPTITLSGAGLPEEGLELKKDQAEAAAAFSLKYDREDRDEMAEKYWSIDAGTITVYAKGNTTKGYYGETKVGGNYDIKQKPLTGGDYALTLSDAKSTDVDNGVVTYYHYVFTGEAIEPVTVVSTTALAVSTLPAKLLEDDDYTVSYDGSKVTEQGECIDAGTYTLWITGIGNFSGKIKATFKVDGATDGIEAEFDNIGTYADKEPTLVLTLNGKPLTDKEDYTVSSKLVPPSDSEAETVNGEKKYTYLFSVNGLTNIKGFSKVFKCPVEPTTLVKPSNLDAPQPKDTYVSSWDYSELTIYPGETVNRPSKFVLSYVQSDGDNRPLKIVDEYKVTEWTPANEPGKGSKMTIEGQGGFTGTMYYDVPLYTDIERADFSTDTEGNQAGTIYDGAQVPITKLQDAKENGTLAELISFKGIWTDEGARIPADRYKVSIDREAFSIGDKLVLTVEGNREKWYTGSRTITVTVTGGLSDDPEITKVVIGKDNTVPWKQQKISPSAVNGDAEAMVQVWDNVTGKKLTYGVDYEADFSNNDKVGIATATITGIGSYQGTITREFKITYPMKDLKITLIHNGEKTEYDKDRIPHYTFNTSVDSNKPKVELTYPGVGGAETMLDDELFYALTYSGYESAKDAKVSIVSPESDAYKGILLGGPISVNYYLDPIGRIDVKIGNDKPIYTGYEMTAENIDLELSYDGKLLKKATDYELTFTNATNIGEAKVIIKLTGNFDGIEERTFTIQPKPLDDLQATAPDLIYTGQPQVPTLDVVYPEGKVNKLVANKDYVVSSYLDLSDHQYTTPFTEIGAYKAVITAVPGGNYTGTLAVPYNIVARQMEDGVVVAFDNTSADCPVINNVPICTYNGKEHKPGIKVVYKTQTLIEGSDYEVLYSDNINAGTAKVTVNGSGSFGGTMDLTFTIAPKDITTDDMIYRDATNTLFEDEKAYPWNQGTSQTPEIVVHDSSRPKNLETVKVVGSAVDAATNESTECVVRYVPDSEKEELEDNQQPCSYGGRVTIEVTGVGNYTGTKEFTYYIGEDISDFYTLVDGKSRVSTTYNGLEQAPKRSQITVQAANSGDLKDENGEERYSVAFFKDGFTNKHKIDAGEIINAGTYYVSVVGVPSKGTYAKSGESNSCIYVINPRSISLDYVLVSGYDGTYYYTGQPIEPKGIMVEDTALPVDASGAQMRSVKLVNGTDFDLTYSNNLTAGKASIIVTGKGNYTGQRAAYFNIISSTVDGNNTWDGTSEGTGSITNGITTIAAADISLGYDNSTYSYMMYTGYARIPTVYINGVDSSEFVVTASNNINPGVATLTITGKGNNYSGTIIKNFTIKANLAQYGVVNPVADQTYTGYQITPYVTVTCGGNLLNSGSDYTVTYSNNINVGTANVIVNAAGDSYYFGSVTGTFNISNTAGGMEITGYASSYTYTGNAISPDVVVMMNGRVLNRGTDYVVSYRNNVNVGMASMTVTGIGSYSGTKTISYAIEARNIENCLTTAVDSYNYTGNTYTPSVTITDSMTGQTLTAGTDYTITYSNNTNPGTATITVTALSRNYTGSKVISFKIKSAAVSGLRASTIKNNRIKLVWSKQSYADGYQICNANNRVIATTDSNSIVVKNLTSCTTYRFKVRSYVENADGSVSYGDFSTAISAKTMLNTPKLKVKSSSKGKVTLTWSKVAKATGYEIYYSTKKNGIYTRLKTVSKSSARKYVDSGLASGEKYYYTIRAYRTANGVKTYSSYNTIKSVKVK